ncbi:MAG: w protein [Osedax symbiont Rs2]|nr:MAG: w protein [Osedax symbiont Rs2]
MYLQGDEMSGMNVKSGRKIDSEFAHIQQSVADIITTPLATRLMRREYGSVLPDLIDQPLNQKTILRLYAAIAIAVIRWEPRYKLIALSINRQGSSAVLDITGTTNDQPNNVSIRL